MARIAVFAVALTILLSATPTGLLAAAGDPVRGARVFQACSSCHSITPGEHMTGPSLADIWNRKAASVRGFERYSDALKRSDIVWTDSNLQRWLAGPEKLVPGATMAFPGLRERKDRDDVIAFLKAVSEGKAATLAMRGGQVSAGGRPDLKQAPPRAQVTAIEHCGDTYSIKTAAGSTDKLWEFNVRLKTDSSKFGPLPGKPVVLGAGMRGDRVSIIFSAPGEISKFVTECR